MVNPRSAGGATGAKLARVRALAAPWFDAPEFLLTDHPGHATELAAEAGSRCELLISVGGDGTANEVVNGLARLPAGARPALGVLPAGTGSDLVRTLGMPRDLSDAMNVLAKGRRRAVDWMRVRYRSADGQGERICINVAGFGMNGEIVKRANEGTKRFGGRITFALATARTAIAWRPPAVAITWEGESGPGSWEGPLASVFLANGQYCGGGMWVGRGGSMSDGWVEATILPELPIWRTATGAPRLYTGTIGRVPGVVTVKVRSMEARVVDSGDVRIDLDGEQPGFLPLRVDVEPGALPVVGQWVG